MSETYPSTLERKLARAVIGTLLDYGFTLGVNDGEETVIHDSRDRAAILAAMGSTDEDWLLVRKPDYSGVVRFIWGNEEDCISDYSLSLERFIGHIQA